jgi:hypothetical protein
MKLFESPMVRFMPLIVSKSAQWPPDHLPKITPFKMRQSLIMAWLLQNINNLVNSFSLIFLHKVDGNLV